MSSCFFCMSARALCASALCTFSTDFFPSLSFLIRNACVRACMCLCIDSVIGILNLFFSFYFISYYIVSFHLLTCFVFSLRQATQLIITLNDIHFYFVLLAFILKLNYLRKDGWRKHVGCEMTAQTNSSLFASSVCHFPWNQLGILQRIGNNNNINNKKCIGS